MSMNMTKVCKNLANKNLSLRLATLEDLEAVSKFDATDHMTAFPQKSGDDFLIGLINSASAYIALIDDKAVGYARVDYIWPERVPLLSWLYVDENNRGIGVADLLRAYVFDAIKGKGYEAILRSACTERPHMVKKLQEKCAPAGSLTFLNGTVEHFFWHKLS